jgi:hypothetical protein
MALTSTEKRIKVCLERLRCQIRTGDDSEILCWPLPGLLACAQRPLRDHPVYARCSPGQSPPPLPPEARPLVEAWVQRVLDAKVRSVICLLVPAQLDKYYVQGGLGLPGGGLLEYYELQGLKVRRRGMTDYQRPTDDEMRQVLKDFDQLPPPVLVHCSAGIDRTTPVAAFLVEQRAGVHRAG